MPRLTITSINQLPERYRQQVTDLLAARRADGVPAKAPTVFRRCAHVRCRQGDACVEPGLFQLVLPGRALTTNRFLSPMFIRDPGVRAARTAEVGRRYKDIKAAAYALAVHERIPTLARGVFSVQAIYTSRLPDAGGLAIVGKAILDGLVEAGVFADDGPDVIGGEWYPAPVRDQAGDRLVVSIAANVSPDQHAISPRDLPFRPPT